MRSARESLPARRRPSKPVPTSAARVTLPHAPRTRRELIRRVTDNEAVRLIHRKQPRQDSLQEGECYSHSYGEHVSDHVEVVRFESKGMRADETPVEIGIEHHVTTEHLKRQFEEKLAARSRRARS